MSKLLGLFATLGLLLIPARSQAYPHYIGYGYPSCATCHFNPMGNGPLTDYGRALGATALAAKPFFVSDKVTDDELGEKSGFLGSVDALPDWLRLQGSYRGMELVSSLESQPTGMWIHMQ